MKLKSILQFYHMRKSTFLFLSGIIIAIILNISFRFVETYNDYNTYEILFKSYAFLWMFLILLLLGFLAFKLSQETDVPIHSVIVSKIIFLFTIGWIFSEFSPNSDPNWFLNKYLYRYTEIYSDTEISHQYQYTNFDASEIGIGIRFFYPIDINPEDVSDKLNEIFQDNEKDVDWSYKRDDYNIEIDDSDYGSYITHAIFWQYSAINLYQPVFFENYNEKMLNNKFFISIYYTLEVILRNSTMILLFGIALPISYKFFPNFYTRK